ncbi:hypothetical protein ACS0TY_026311 [Phlomoides rotata]
MRKVIGISDEDCINHLRMSRGVFCRFCHLLETSDGLKSTQNCTIAEKVAMLSILAHHTKNHIVKSNVAKIGLGTSWPPLGARRPETNFFSIPIFATMVKSNHIRSGQTVSKHFHSVLNSVIRLHSILLVNLSRMMKIAQTGSGDTLRYN